MEESSLGVWFPAVKSATGTDQYTERLVEALRRRGVKAEISWLPHRAEYLPWSVSVPKAPQWANIVHVNSWLHSRFIPHSLPCLVTLHSCVHDSSLSPYKSSLQAIYHKHWIYALESKLVESAEVVTAVSEYTASVGRAAFGREDIQPIHNWVDTEVFYPDIEKKKNDTFRLLYVGSLSLRKGVDLLCKIMAKLGDGFEILYTGDQEELNSFGEECFNMRAIGRIKGDEKLAAHYRACDAVLFPTRLEGFGLVALEASACGIPVIASRCSSIPEIIVDGETGILCDVDSVEQFVDAVVALRDDPELYSRVSEQARRRAITYFTEDIAVEKYIGIYKTMLGGHNDK